jgi:hypothetical protein
MGYNTSYKGAIQIEPPLTWAEIKDSPYLPDAAWNKGLDVKLNVVEEIVDTDEGTLTRRSADAIVPVTEDSYKGYDIVQTVQKLIDAHPGHEFTGRFDCEGDDSGDVWRLVVKNGRAVKVKAQIVWPED